MSQSIFFINRHGLLFSKREEEKFPFYFTFLGLGAFGMISSLQMINTDPIIFQLSTYFQRCFP